MIQLKSRDDVNRIRDASLILVQTHELLSSLIEPGITTKELDNEAYGFITKNGAIPSFLHYHGYPASICTSVNEQIIHGIPGPYKLRSGDIISVDIGVTLNGYISDGARTFPVGTISEKASKLLRVTEECLYLAIQAASAGNRIRDISAAVYNHARNADYGVVREYCGHGVGFQLHEDPQVPNYISRSATTRLKEGMVIAIEPMINMGSDDICLLPDDWTVATADNSLSAHFEHTIAIFDDHTEILTSAD
ncbi:MAG: type I methionyl aminopeptidase [Spirochaetales bacterium]|nr:type I methionyl aminopeptidase [Spirochaetales bacterium]